MGAALSKRRPPGAEEVLALAALLLVLGAALVRLAGGHPSSLIAIGCLVAPGFAATALLPAELRRAPLSWLLAPPLGFAISSILLISAAGLGLPLTDGVIYILLAGACAAGLAAAVRFSSSAPLPRIRERAAAAPEIPLLLAGAVLLGIGLEAKAIGGTPLPGADWAHYLLYSSEIARHHGLLLENPYWMLGNSSFAEDPGVPSLYGAYLILSGHGAGLLYHGIWVFAALGILTTYVFVRTLFGDIAGVVAAAVYAVAPLGLNILTWHGLANVYAIMYVPLILLAAGMMLRGRVSVRWSGFLALFLVALVAGHRLSFLIVAVALLLLGVLALVRAPRPTLTFALRTALFGVACGFGVAVYLVRQANSLGGLQSYKVYLPTKIDSSTLEMAARYLSWPLIVAAVLGLGVILLRRRLRVDAAAYVPIAFLAALLLVGVSYIVHFPTEYSRVVYYLPIPVAALIGIGITGIPSRAALLVGVLLVAVIAPLSYTRAGEARDFFTFVDPGSERGLAYLSRRLEPGDVVAADRCWSFLATWELRHRVLGGLDPSLSLAGSEARPASVARKILVGSRGSVRLARRYGVHYALIDPICTDELGRPPVVPTHGAPVYESTHLVIIRF
ncbi:MAG TPA: hypothetical protein VKB23_04360 [Solirubrobacterales bacterium]|nr:hypothetical protein [Solirubrobacterales bacterium]